MNEQGFISTAKNSLINIYDAATLSEIQGVSAGKKYRLNQLSDTDKKVAAVVVIISVVIAPIGLFLAANLVGVALVNHSRRFKEAKDFSKKTPMQNIVGGTLLHKPENLSQPRRALKGASSDYNSYVESQPTTMQALQATMQSLPQNFGDVPPKMMDLSLADVEAAKKDQLVASLELPNVIDGCRHFDIVLKELDRLKDRLGGSLHFDTSGPSLDDVDSKKTFFGIPMPAVKDWFVMTLKKEWVPRKFWKAVAGAFHVSLDKSQYEEAHVRIQRFGMLVANKERFNEILENRNQSRYKELLTITGMMWHPGDNGWGTEKTYIQFIEKFLTTDFEAAKGKGDDALVEYFNAFEGVCFEDRCRHLEEYAASHPTDQEIASVRRALKEIPDINLDLQVCKAFDEVGAKLLSSGERVNPLALLEVAKTYIFGKAFPTDGGAKAVATLQDFQDYAIEMIGLMALESYSSIEELLKVELDILKESGKEINVINFKKQLERLNGKEIVEDGVFSVNDYLIEEFMLKQI